jgi:hypothetical protein
MLTKDEYFRMRDEIIRRGNIKFQTLTEDDVIRVFEAKALITSLLWLIEEKYMEQEK